MNAKAKAVLSDDGKEWILNGEKMWLTNGGFADIYITFCKVDGEHFTAFIIDKGSPGVSLGAEEKKTGIKGSSTCPLVLQDARDPQGESPGRDRKGHKIAFNILNVGRFKLGAGTTGGCKGALKISIDYAKSRTAFGKPIADFGLIKQKLAQMAINAYVSESAVYRTAGMIDQNLAGVTPDEALKRIEEYDVECSIVKVLCSELLDDVADETVQLFGGAGYVEDYPAERYWRDARVNRIFEGTNEINRLLIPGRLMRRAMKGGLPLFEKAQALVAELTTMPAMGVPTDGPAPEGNAGRCKEGCGGEHWDSRAKVRPGSPGAAGGAEPLRRRHPAGVRAGERAAASAEKGCRSRPGQGRPSGRRRPLLRPGCDGSSRGFRPQGSRRRRGRRHAASLPGGPEALYEERRLQYGRPKTPNRRRGARERKLSTRLELTERTAIRLCCWILRPVED